MGQSVLEHEGFLPGSWEGSLDALTGFIWSGVPTYGWDRRTDSLESSLGFPRSPYHSTGSKFERFREFFELLSRFEFDFRR